MSDSRVVRAATPGRSVDGVEHVKGVHLPDLPPFTTVLAQTMNSSYHVMITRWPKVYVQGGPFFPEPTAAYLDGASAGGSCLRGGWIGVGLQLAISSGGRRIITSLVRTITIEEPPGR